MMTTIAILSEPVALANVVQALAAVFGFLFVVIQLRAGTQDRLYAHYMEVCKLFMENSELRPCFYESDANADKASPDPSKVAFMCEAILGLVEHAVLQKQYMPRDAWEHCWRPYAVERLEHSEALQKFFDPNSHW